MLATLLMSLSLFASAFSGTWVCHFRGHDTTWRIAAAPGSAWTSVRGGDQSSDRGGIAHVGCAGPQKRWVYRDFHYDGSYGDASSPGPVNGTWTWSGPFYLSDRVLEGAALWNLTNTKRIDWTFEALQHGKLVPTASDYCTKQ